MRVALDALAVAKDRKGLGRFQAQLASKLNSHWADQLQVTALTGPTFDPSSVLGAIGLETTKLRSRHDLFRAAIAIPSALRRLAPEVYVTTTDRLRVPRHMPVILYVFEHPAYRTRLQGLSGVEARTNRANDITLRWFGSTVRRADRIVAASTSTARDLVFFAGVDPRKLSVAMPGPFLELNGDESLLLSERQPIVLTFIDRDVRDNGPTVVDAFSQGTSEPWELHVVGDADPYVVSKATASGASARIVFHGRLDDAGVGALYARSSVYLDASLYEGFGAQAAEATAAGLACVVSGVTSLPEVVGANGILVDPHRPATIAAALQGVTKRALRDLSSIGPKEATNADRWESLSAHLVALCQELAQAR